MRFQTNQLFGKIAPFREKSDFFGQAIIIFRIFEADLPDSFEKDFAIPPQDLRAAATDIGDASMD